MLPTLVLQLPIWSMEKFYSLIISTSFWHWFLRLEPISFLGTIYAEQTIDGPLGSIRPSCRP